MKICNMHCKRIGLLLTMLLLLLLPSGVWAEEETESVTKLQEIVVTGTRTSHAIKDVPVETTLITREDIEKSNAQTVTDIVKTIPGLSATGTDDIFGSGSSRARLRGLSFNNGYGLILIDGQRIHGSSQSGAHGEYAVGLNQIPVSMIERIEVVKGPSSVLYGSDAMAGVINIITRKVPEKATTGAGVKYGWYKVSKSLNYYTDAEVTPSDYGKHRIARNAYAYAGNKINDSMGFLFNYDHEDSEGTSTSPYDYNRDSAMGKFDVVFSDTVSAWVKGEISEFERTTTSVTAEDSYRIAAGLDFDISENHMLMFKGYHYLDEFSTSSRDGEIGFDQIEFQYTWNTGVGHVLTLGSEFQRQGIDYYMNNTATVNDVTVETTTTVKEDVDTFSVYLQDEWTLFDKLVLVPGLRWDDHSTFGDSFNPKLNVMYRVLENTSLRASVGKSFKSPTIRQLYYDVPFWHSPFWIASNPDLEPEESIGYSAGIEQWLFDNKGMVNISYFRNEITDMVVTDTTGQTYEDAPLYIYENVEEATVQGVEVTAQFYPNDSFSLTAGYTFTDSEDESTGNDLTYTPDHAFSISPAYEYMPWGLGVSGTLAYASDQYTDTDNTRTQDAHVIVDGKIFKRLSKMAKITFEMDNIFDSDHGDDRYTRTGRTFTVGMDMEF
ncbi:TonB-dependent receptor plug domain-containing protein [Desulfosarcina ovata]|uniref:Ligand-gated channel protein n=1 Tax=Desulfosarcina ovata subsp. ovata TaxID=2752305 RepID=A0A5K8AAK6_9BACT|nr:TonB-dependent receptor [Desulfosarcina ovata]BBO89508.1 ligand-gated channel protein [Desulfosarcina ovata subsp. ovata]